MKMHTRSLVSDRAGWRVREWCRELGIARSTYYALGPEYAPTAVHVGVMHIITESPRDWLARVGKARKGC
jgi:hypothetical protein